MEVSAHFVVARDGEHRPVRLHARPRLARRPLELARPRELQRLFGRHRTRRAGGRDLRAVQYERLADLLIALLRRLPLASVAGHEHVAPGRKFDPGAGFDWPRAHRPARLARSVFSRGGARHALKRFTGTVWRSPLQSVASMRFRGANAPPGQQARHLPMWNADAIGALRRCCSASWCQCTAGVPWCTVPDGMWHASASACGHEEPPDIVSFVLSFLSAATRPPCTRSLDPPGLVRVCPARSAVRPPAPPWRRPAALFRYVSPRSFRLSRVTRIFRTCASASLRQRHCGPPA